MADETAERDLTGYATKAPTDQQVHFAEWIPEVTGYNPNGAKSKMEAFNEGVRLAKALVMVHQSSPEWRAARDVLNREKAAAKASEEESAPPKKAPAKKAAKKAAPVAEEELAEEESAPPAKAAKKAAPATRRRAAAANQTEAPF